jgi:hypothetical protein
MNNPYQYDNLIVNGHLTTWNPQNTAYVGQETWLDFGTGGDWFITGGLPNNVFCTGYNHPTGLSPYDPSNPNIDWGDCSVTIPSAGAQGDPHINPILGSPYTI